MPDRLWDQMGDEGGPQSVGKSRGGWNTKIHMVAADARTAVTFSLSPGGAHDAPEGRKLLRGLGPVKGSPRLLMDRAYEGDETRQLALDFGFEPVVPPKKNRLNPWEVRPRNLQATQRGGAPVPTAEGLSPHCHPLRQSSTRCSVFVLIFDTLLSVNTP